MDWNRSNNYPSDLLKFWVILLLLCVVSSVCAEDQYQYFTLACPFQTVTDEIASRNLLNLLDADFFGNGEIRKIYLSPEASDLPLFNGKFEKWVRSDAADRITQNDEGVICAVLPLDEVDPTMKLVSVDQSYFPWDDEYDPNIELLAMPSAESNFDRDKVSTVLLTGTTALARTVAYKMAQNGVLYPAEMVKSVFDSSDITHISNESTLWSLCPKPRLDNKSLQLCSPANAIEIFDYLGVDVIELTGNHLRDFDWKPMLEMLDVFDEKGYAYYGGGWNEEDAAEPLFLEHNGNRFVFLGCNCAGPDHVYATERLPGALHCDFDKMEEQIHRYAEEGWIPIVTLQYYEVYIHAPTEIQTRDFQRMSDAGAVIVSGSQSHYPQTMVPLPDRFIHYGLGNLFFDQMDVPVKGTRRGFMDRYVFYDGKLLTVQLITTLLEDYSRPRLMTPTEREQFLAEVFSAM